MGAYMGFGVWVCTCCLHFLHDESVERDFLRDFPLDNVCDYSLMITLIFKYQIQEILHRCHCWYISMQHHKTQLSVH